MVILGIDPGLAIVGWGVIDYQGSRFRTLAYGSILTPAGMETPARLSLIHRELTEIIKQNDIKSVTVTRMQVPCCGGIENAVKRALMASGKFIPWQVMTISTDGRILD